MRRHVMGGRSFVRQRISSDRFPSTLIVAAFTIALTASCDGCERGCLLRSLGGEGPNGGGGEAPSHRSSPRPGIDLGGTDCSDGLLRCVDGRVEASRLAHLPSSCGASGSRGKRNPENPGCSCPWDVLSQCTTGCADDGLEVLGSASAAIQLCRPEQPVARRLLPGDPVPTDICAGESLACIDQIVRVCDAPGQPVTPVAFCLHGCEASVGIERDALKDGPVTNPDGVASILCRRHHAERQ